MINRLVISSQLAATNPSDVFAKDWSWPVAQPHYDDPITEFIRWSDELHVEIGDSSRLLNAFLLVKADLLKDLSYYTAAWVDISEARRSGSEIISDPSQFIYSSIISNEFDDRLPTANSRIAISAGVRPKLRQRLSRFKRQLANRRAVSGASEPICFLIGPNQLGEQIAPPTSRVLRLSTDDVYHRRTKALGLPTHVQDVAHLVADEIVSIISKHRKAPTAAFAGHMLYITKQYLKYGWFDAGIPSIFRPSKPNATLVTGTGSGYSARFISHQFISDGHRVLRTTHGGDPALFHDVLWPSIEFPFASTYIAHGEIAADSLSSTIRGRTESKIPNYTQGVLAAGSGLHARIRESAQIIISRPIKTVSVIAASFTGMLRVTPHMKLHDVVYIEWHRRLLSYVRQFGYTTLSKRHPKGMMAGQRVFDDVASEELIRTPMSEIEHRTDAYVIDFPASAFMEAICTMKPVVLIDLPIRKMRADAREAISKSVQIVSASFDERNRVVIDPQQLREALQAKVDIDSRESFIQDYLLRPSVETGSLFE